MRRTLVLSLTALVLTGGVVTGCGSGSGSGSAPPSGSATIQAAPTESNPAGDIPDNQAYVAYQPAGGGFTVKVPEGWARTTKGSTVTFTDKLNRIEITSGKAATKPTPQSVKSAVVPVLQRQLPKFQMGKVTIVSRPGGQAVLLTYRGNSTPDPVTGKVAPSAFERYSFFKSGQQVDLTLSGPVGADNVDPWRTVTDSFRWQ
ncbi:hypothetical protein ACIBKZ_06475 [Streptomyces sp. NPDC050421]|uniref:hypothetical protein n=1 Tax=Streptomyces sp. NPDC050421 TaxID=3365613 RepID=UPI0037AD517E